MGADMCGRGVLCLMWVLLLFSNFMLARSEASSLSLLVAFGLVTIAGFAWYPRRTT